MSLKSIIIFLLTVNFYLSESATVRIHFARCGFNGFTCSTISKTNTQAIVFQCPSDDVTLFINQFTSPSNIESFQIQHCRNLTISFRCSGEIKNIKSLIIKNVTLLAFQRQQYTSHVPTAVSFENIAYIEEIPSFTFSQIDKTIHSAGCVTPQNDFHTISFKSVKIGTVQSNAFHMPANFGDFSFTNVKVNRIQTSAIFAKHDKVSEFRVENSEIDVVEHLAFQATAKTVTFVHNKFIDIASSALNGTTENFEFTDNFVNTLQPYSISILCTNVHILKNKFEYLKSGALEKISPGLLEDSGRNFGTLKFIYEFKNNTITHMDAGCLNPDYVAYKNVATELVVQGNRMLCECANIGWIFPGIGHGYNTKTLESFYESVLDVGNNNICLSSCDLPLSTAIRQFKNGKCLGQITSDWICENKNKIDSTSASITTKTSTTSSAIAPSKQTIPRTWVLTLNRSSIALASIDLILLITVTVLCIA